MNTYEYTGPGTRWAEEDPTAEDFLNVSRGNCDHLHEALSRIMDTDAADGRISQLLTEVAVNSVKTLLTSEWDPASGTPAVGQGIRWAVKLSDLSNNQDVVGALDWVATNVTHGAEDYRLDVYAMKAGAISTARMSLSSAALYPGSNDGLALGVLNTGEWSDLRLASGAVVSWANADVTLTHSSNALVWDGASSGYTFQVTGVGFVRLMDATPNALEQAVSFLATSNIANYYTNTYAPSGASNDFDFQLLPAVTLDNAGSFYEVYARLPTVTAAKTLAIARMFHVADTAGAGTITAKYAFSNDALSGAAYSFYNAGGTFFSASGYRVGTDSTNNLIDDASNGAGTAALYIGNASINVTSDARAKLDAQVWQGDPLDLVLRARLWDFVYDRISIHDESEWGPSSRGRYLGLMAQEVIEWAPWAVNAGNAVDCPTCRAGKRCERHEHLWTTEYDHLVPLLFAALQRQQEQIDALTTRRMAA